VLPHYRNEAAALARNPDDPDYSSWVHVRRHGSWPVESSDEKPRGASKRDGE
jgi:hypothetical protein